MREGHRSTAARARCRARCIVPAVLVRGVLLLALGALGCATVRPLSEETARALSQHEFEGDADDVLDAAWLTLQARGYVATASNRTAGTVSLTRDDGHGYDVSVSTGDEGQMLTAQPRSPRPLVLGGDDGEDARWDALWHGVRTLLDTWRAFPEWRYETRTNTLKLPDFAFQPPKAWAFLDFDIHRRRVRVLKERGPHTGTLMPTVLAVVERRHPESTLPALLQEAAGVALTARSRLTVPDDIEATREGDGLGGTVRLLDGTTAREVRWHTLARHTAAWTVTLVAVCGVSEAPCEAEWRAVVASVVTPKP
jgi:hypothetical protein